MSKYPDILEPEKHRALECAESPFAVCTFSIWDADADADEKRGVKFWYFGGWRACTACLWVYHDHAALPLAMCQVSRGILFLTLLSLCVCLSVKSFA